jgi:hypothetical protein
MTADPIARMTVGVVIERHKAASPWIDFVWRPLAVLPGVPEAAPWTPLEDVSGTRATFYAGAADISLHPKETSNYRDNLATGAPGLWVVMRATGGDPPYRIVVVTADPNEGEAYTESGDDLVESVPMPDPIRAQVEAFVAEHHVDRPFYKRERTRADLEVLAPRTPRPKGESR